MRLKIGEYVKLSGRGLPSRKDTWYQVVDYVETDGYPDFYDLRELKTDQIFSVTAYLTIGFILQTIDNPTELERVIYDLT